MGTIIHSNGSKWNGQEPGTVDVLIDVLGKWRLDKERFRRFTQRQSNGAVRFFGNFMRLSHVFDIETNDADVISRLMRAIRNNGRVKYDPVDAYYLAVVKEAGNLNGRWHRESRGFANEKTKVVMSFDDMQKLANDGKVWCY